MFRLIALFYCATFLLFYRASFAKPPVLDPPLKLHAIQTRDGVEISWLIPDKLRDPRLRLKIMVKRSENSRKFRKVKILKNLESSLVDSDTRDFRRTTLLNYQIIFSAKGFRKSESAIATLVYQPNLQEHPDEIRIAPLNDQIHRTSECKSYEIQLFKKGLPFEPSLPLSFISNRTESPVVSGSSALFLTSECKDYTDVYQFTWPAKTQAKVVWIKNHVAEFFKIGGYIGATRGSLDVQTLNLIPLAVGKLKALAVRFEFKDTKLEPQCSEDNVTRLMSSIAAYYKDVSFQNLQIEPAVTTINLPYTKSEVYGGLQNNNPDDCIPPDKDESGWSFLTCEANKKAQEKGYSHSLAIAPEPDNGISYFWGIGNFNAGQVLVYEHCVYSSYSLHEFGHAIGLGHANGFSKNDRYWKNLSLPRPEHTDWDHSTVMGITSDIIGMNAPHLAQLGWLTSKENIKVAKSGTYVISSLTQPSPVPSLNPKVIRIDRKNAVSSSVGQAEYYISARSRIGVDKNLPEIYEQTISIHTDAIQVGDLTNGLSLAPDNKSESRQVTLLKPQEVFYDPINKIEITLLQRDSETATVKIDFSGDD